MKLEAKFDGENCLRPLARLPWQPRAEFCFHKGSSSQANQSASNQQVATTGAGAGAFGANAVGNTNTNAAAGATVFNNNFGVNSGSPVASNDRHARPSPPQRGGQSHGTAAVTTQGPGSSIVAPVTTTATTTTTAGTVGVTGSGNVVEVSNDPAAALAAINPAAGVTAGAGDEVKSNNATTVAVVGAVTQEAQDAINANANLSANAIAALTAATGTNATLAAVAIGNATDEASAVINANLQSQNAQDALINNIVNNFGAVVSQAVTAFTNHAAAPAVLAAAPAYNYYAPAGSSETAQDSTAINASAANQPVTSQNVAPVGSGTGSGLTGGQIAALVLGVAAVAAVIYIANK